MNIFNSFKNCRKIYKHIIPGFTILVGTIFLNSCRTEERFLELGTKFAGPIDVAQSGDYFYVLNSDFDRRYDQGSIVILNPSATPEKVKAIPTRRMGRSLHVSGNWMLVTFDQDQFSGPAKVELRGIEEQGVELPLKVSWEINCSPVNGIISPGGNYIVVSCIGGDIWAGRLNQSDPSQSNLQLVRQHGFTRRALYIYESAERAVLFAFPTDIGDPNISDLSLEDAKTYNPKGPNASPNDNGELILEEGANEVPDAYENEVAALRRSEQRFPYQMIIYDLKKAEAEGFPLINNGGIISPTQADNERKFIYFNLKKSDGTSDVADQESLPNRKYYRTNFWEAQPDPTDPEVFYLSHRGPPASPHSNNIVKVTITPQSIADTASLPKSSEILAFERVSGFPGEKSDARNYTSDFAIELLNNDKVLFINHFRDAVYWDAAQQKFSVEFRRLDAQPSELREVVGAGFEQSFYQLAVNQEGIVVSCSFYGDSVLVLEADLRTGINLVKHIY